MSFARGLVLPQKSPQVARGSPEAPNREVYQVRSCNLEANEALFRSSGDKSGRRGFCGTNPFNLGFEGRKEHLEAYGRVIRREGRADVHQGSAGVHRE